MPAAGVLMIGAGATAGATTFAGAMMVIGGVMSTVGYITENEDMMKAGSVVGLVGSFGSSAAGQSLFGKVTAEAGTGTELASASAAETAANTVSGSGASGTSAYTGTASELAADGLGGVADVATQTASPAVEATTTGVMGAQPAAQPLNYSGTAQQLADNASKWSGATANASGGLADTLKTLTSSKEFWNGAMQAFGGYLQGEGNKKIADNQLKAQKMQWQYASDVPELGNALKVKEGATPFKVGPAPVYTAPKINSIMG